MRELDPIMLCPIQKPFYLLRNGSMILFDATSLYQYVKTSGDMRDPVARQPFATHELMRLARVCGQTYISKEGLLQVYRGEIGRRELLTFLENEFLEASHNPIYGLTMMFEVLTNIRAIATAEEFAGAMRHFQRNGITISASPTNPAAFTRPLSLPGNISPSAEIIAQLLPPILDFGA